MSGSDYRAGRLQVEKLLVYVQTQIDGGFASVDKRSGSEVSA